MINRTKNLIKRVYHILDDNLTAHMRLLDIIFFEGAPDFQDNSRFIYEEMLQRNLNEKYAMYWAVDHPEKFEGYPVENIFFVKKGSKDWKNTSRRSRILLSCNYPFYKTVQRPDQLYIHLGHGCAFKSCGSLVYAPRSATYINRMSMYNADIEAKSMNISIEKIIALGHARNDIFYRPSNIDAHKIFPDSDFQKLILWLPTFRQNISGTRVYSSIKLPIIHSVEDAYNINEIAKQKKLLIVLKPHYNQNLSGIDLYNLSNLKIIKDQYLFEKGITLYELLSLADAMMTDYSSVFQDFLNANKPIGLCWEDFDEFNEREGFDIDVKPIQEAGEIINSMQDFERFATNISKGRDEKGKKRQELNLLVNPFQDGKASKRMVDFIETWISKQCRR